MNKKENNEDKSKPTQKTTKKRGKRPFGKKLTNGSQIGKKKPDNPYLRKHPDDDDDQ